MKEIEGATEEAEGFSDRVENVLWSILIPASRVMPLLRYQGPLAMTVALFTFNSLAYYAAYVGLSSDNTQVRLLVALVVGLAFLWLIDSLIDGAYRRGYQMGSTAMALQSMRTERVCPGCSECRPTGKTPITH